MLFAAAGAQTRTLSLISPWRDFGDGYGSASWFMAGHTCIVSGLIRLEQDGLASWKNNIATLPKQCRPIGRLAFLLNQHEESHRIDVLPSGAIIWVNGRKITNWLSLDGIAFSTGMLLDTAATCAALHLLNWFKLWRQIVPDKPCPCKTAGKTGWATTGMPRIRESSACVNCPDCSEHPLEFPTEQSPLYRCFVVPTLIRSSMWLVTWAVLVWM